MLLVHFEGLPRVLQLRTPAPTITAEMPAHTTFSRGFETSVFYAVALAFEAGGSVGGGFYIT